MRYLLSRRSVLIGGASFAGSALMPRSAGALQAIRAIPKGFNSIGVRPISVKPGFGPGRIELSHTPRQLALERNPQLNPRCGYIDERDGSFFGTGSSQSPFGTIDDAAANSEFDNFIVRAGRYAPPTLNINDPSNANTGRRLKQFFLAPGVVIKTPGPLLQEQTFLLHSRGVYKTKLKFIGEQTVDRVAIRGLYDQGAQLSPLARFLKKDDLIQSDGPGWSIFSTFGDKDLYIRLPGNISVEAFKKNLVVYYLDAERQSSWSVNGAPCAIYAKPNTVVFDGVSLIGSDAGGFQGEIYADGIYSRFAQEAAFQTFGGVNFFKRCVAYASGGDCFNYNASTALGEASNIEHDCLGIKGGDIETFGIDALPISNGSSAHKWASILRAGCVYDGNWGPQVADVADGGVGASWNIACVTGPTPEPQSIGFFSADAGRASFWDQCRAFGNKTAISSTGGLGKAHACEFDGAVVGTIEAYDPITGF